MGIMENTSPLKTSFEMKWELNVLSNIPWYWPLTFCMGIPLPTSGFYLGTQPAQQSNDILASGNVKGDLAAGSAVSPSRSQLEV